MPLPNVVVAGAPRCGTTSLFRWAAAHPQIVTSRRKETRYLNDAGYPLFNPRHNFLADGMEGYQRLFPYRVGARVYLEATPDYLYQQTALSVLTSLSTKPTIIFLLRDPVERMLSLFHYAMNNVGSLDRGLSIRDCFVASRDGVPIGDQILNSAFVHSIYHIWLEKWFSGLGRSRIQIYFFDDLASDPRSLMRDFCHRVDVDDEFYVDFPFRAENQAYVVRSPTLARAKFAMRRLVPAYLPYRGIIRAYRAINVRRDVRPPAPDAGLIQEMRESFAEPNRRLALLLGRDLPKTWS
ncbi:MAG: sulfotransferase domain-containing protein [Steroidobacteraceae bacterium]